MKLGIMQPYFFPYPGYFSLIAQCDKWVVFDIPQYIRHGWVNRNRILHPGEGWQYIVVPLKKHGRNTPICDVRISDNENWSEKILHQLAHYRKRAPFFDDTMAFIKDCLSGDQDSLASLNVEILKKSCAHIGIELDTLIASELTIETDQIQGPGDWALVISKHLGASEYINPPGGAHLFDTAAFEEAGIKLTIQRYDDMEYSCRGYNYVPGLSIIDALMWNSPEKIRKHIRNYDN